MLHVAVGKRNQQHTKKKPCLASFMALEMDTLATKTQAHTLAQTWHTHTHTPCFTHTVSASHTCGSLELGFLSSLRAHQMKLPLCNVVVGKGGRIAEEGKTPKNETFAAFVAFLCPGNSSSGSSKAHKCQLLSICIPLPLSLSAPLSLSLSLSAPCRCPLLAADAAFYELLFLHLLFGNKMNSTAAPSTAIKWTK